MPPLAMTHRQVIDLWPTHRDLSELLGVARNTVSMMYRADNIHVRHWCTIIENAPEVGLWDLAQHVRSHPE